MQLAFEVAEASPLGRGGGQLMVAHSLAHTRQSHLPGYAAHAGDPLAPLAPAGPAPRPRRAPPRGAATLSQALHPVEAPADLRHHEARLRQAAAERPRGVLDHLPRLAAHVGGALQPQGDTHNDDTPGQRFMNVATSLPFLAVGAHMLRTHQSPEGRRYAGSVLAVGAVATAYHASSGPARRLLRKADYWTIAASTTTLMKALWPDRKLLHHALHLSALAIPFKPFVLSTAHTLVMQAEFARQASAHAAVRPKLGRHLAAAAVGTAMFALEDVLAERGFGHVHALWHCLACASVASTGSLVRHKEQLRLAAGAGGGGGVKAALRPCHDSVSSLRSLDKC